MSDNIILNKEINDFVILAKQKNYNFIAKQYPKKYNDFVEILDLYCGEGQYWKSPHRSLKDLVKALPLEFTDPEIKLTAAQNLKIKKADLDLLDSLIKTLLKSKNSDIASLDDQILFVLKAIINRNLINIENNNVFNNEHVHNLVMLLAKMNSTANEDITLVQKEILIALKNYERNLFSLKPRLYEDLMIILLPSKLTDINSKLVGRSKAKKDLKLLIVNLTKIYNSKKTDLLEKKHLNDEVYSYMHSNSEVSINFLRQAQKSLLDKDANIMKQLIQAYNKVVVGGSASCDGCDKNDEKNN